MADGDSMEGTNSFLATRPSEEGNSLSPSQQQQQQEQQQQEQEQPAMMDSSVISTIKSDSSNSSPTQSAVQDGETAETAMPSSAPTSTFTDTMTTPKNPSPPPAATTTTDPKPNSADPDSQNPAMEGAKHSPPPSEPLTGMDHDGNQDGNSQLATTTIVTDATSTEPMESDSQVAIPPASSSAIQHHLSEPVESATTYNNNADQSSHVELPAPSLSPTDSQPVLPDEPSAQPPLPSSSLSPKVTPKQEDMDTVMHDTTQLDVIPPQEIKEEREHQVEPSALTTTGDMTMTERIQENAPSSPPENRSPAPPIDYEMQPSASTATTGTLEQQPPTASVEATTPGAAVNSNGAQNGYRPLNVKDALSYLDQVKVQFSEHPEVYNKFLDIMKDFKSQAIDTPGVIERVSSLFRGHPLLISGFNTFLPPGYCIECITDENNHDIIKVTTPTGITTTNAGEPVRLGSETTGTPTHEQLYYGASGYGYGGGRTSTTATMYAEGHNAPMTIHHLQHSGQHLPPSASGQQHHHPLGHPHHQQQSGHHLQHPPMTGQQQLHHPIDDGLGNRRPPVEFNHAINYVNKIKNRFSSDPDIYKQFLEILQTYQKEQRPIQEVYSQVQVLFNGDNDLLAEFKQFLPDTTGGPSSAVYTSTPHGKKGLMMIPGLPYVSQGRKKRANTMMAPGLSKRSKLQNKLDTQTSEVRSGMSLDQEMVRPFVSGEEVEFFERVKKYIGSKATYNAFLKVLNLFSQQIVDQNVLVNRVEGFIGGNKDLFDMFKTLVGYDGKDEIVENIPSDTGKPDLALCRACGPSYRLIPKSWEQSQVCSGKDELCLEVLNDRYVSHPTWASEDSGYVTSKKNQYEEALHRVEEERYDYDLNIEANLNTIALLEPIMKKISAMNAEEKMDFTLAVGLGGPSKTIYQRIIKKIYGNEKGLQVIGLLHSSPAQTVPIVLRRLKQKDDEWKRAQREWNKIWREVEAKNYFKALDYQGITFKANDKRRITTKHLINEIEERRSHQQEEQHQTHEADAMLVPRRKPSQFTFDFKQQSVIKDVMRLIYYFFERTELYSTENQDKMRTFMETLLPLVFGIETVLPDEPSDSLDTTVGMDLDEANGGESTTAMEDDEEDSGMAEDGDGDDEAGDEADDEEDEESRSGQYFDSDDDKPGRSSTTRGSAKKTNGGGTRRTLLKDILTENIRQATNDFSSSVAGAAQSESENESVSKRDPQQQQEDMDVDVPEASDTVPPTDNAMETKSESKPTVDKMPKDSANKRHIYNLFGDSEFYCFFRLYQILYDRLCQMKALDEAYEKHPVETKRALKAPLKLKSKAKTFAALDYQANFSSGYYQALLTLIEKFFEGDVDQQSFEEISRYIFGSKAYVMFTIDKVVLALIRHTHVIVTHEKTSALLDLFKQDHGLEHVDAQTLGNYRLCVEELEGKEEVLFNIAYDTIRQTLSIQILGDDEEHEKSAGDNYEEYVSHYIDWANATKGIDPLDLTPRFLKRNLATSHGREEEEDAQQKNLFVQSGMQYKICRDTYHMFYIIGTEDILMRLPSTQPSIPVSSSSQSQSSQSSSLSSSPNTKWKSWLESDQGWSKGITDKDQAEKDARQLLFAASIQ